MKYLDNGDRGNNAVGSMMRAALDDKNVWNAGGLSLLSSAANARYDDRNIQSCHA